MFRVAVVVALAAFADAKCNREYDSTDLSSAIDAALTELQGTQGWFYHLGDDFGHSYWQINSCTPDFTKWDYPAASAATGLLRRVLDSGELKVAATPWAAGATSYCEPEATSCSGSAANGVQNPVGYWVDMLADIAAKLSAQYEKTINVRRVYFDNSDLVNDAVANHPELVDMSEPYYYLGAFFNSEPRFEHFHFSCITAAANSEFFALKGNGITSTPELVERIATATKIGDRSMGFIGAGNFDAVSSILPSNVNANYNLGEFQDIIDGVVDGNFIAGYKSEGGPLNASLFEVFPTGIISPRAILYRLDEECVCEATVAKAEKATEKAENNEAGLTAALVVVSSVLLVVVLLLALVIVRERVQKPLFMPLLPAPAAQTGIETGKV